MNVITGSISTYVFTIRRSRPEFLALLRAEGLAHAGTWQAVHGLIEPGEKAYDAAFREMREETGVAPERFFKTDYVETFYSEATDGVHLVPAFAGYIGENANIVLSEEHVQYAWCSLDEVLRRLVWPSQRAAVQVIADAVHEWPDVGHAMRELSAHA
jgi:dATP pyrophosphohydrolase